MQTDRPDGAAEKRQNALLCCRPLRRSFRALIMALTVCLIAPPIGATALKEDVAQVQDRNAFADGVMALHEHWRQTRNIREAARPGGYQRRPNFFTEVSYIDTANDQLMSRIRWLQERPDVAQMVEVFVYGDDGRLKADYYLSYLEQHRNAPLDAVVNVHAHGPEISAFRQYDSTGEILLEQCQGTWNGRAVDVSIDDPIAPSAPSDVAEDVYAACFGNLAWGAGDYLQPRLQALTAR